MKTKKKFTYKKLAATPPFCKQNFSWVLSVLCVSTYSSISNRALVRAGGTGGMPPVNFSQRVAATRQIWQQ